MRKKVFLYLIIVFIFLLTLSCKSQIEQIECFKKNQLELSSDTMVTFLRNSLKDSVEDWVKKDLKLKGHDYGIAEGFNNSNWRIDDNVLFNKNKTRAVLSILTQYHPDSSSLDYVHLISAEILNNKWSFYYVAMPLMTYSHSKNNNQAYTHEQLSQKIVLAYINGGYFKNGTCKINYRYIDEWIVSEGTDMYKYHQRFLESGKDLDNVPTD